MDVSIALTLTSDDTVSVGPTIDQDIAIWIARREHRSQQVRSRSRRAFVGERDGWICQLCRGPINRRLGASHPHTGTLDHRIPQADGGSHALDNLQIAHAVCNHVRGDLPLEFVDVESFAAVRDGVLRWLKAQDRYRTAEQRRERARRRWSRWCQRARQGTRSGGYSPTITDRVLSAA